VPLGQQLAGDGNAGGFPPARHQRPGKRFQIILLARAKQRLGQQRPALLGNRIQKLLQKRDVQIRPPWWPRASRRPAVNLWLTVKGQHQRM